MESIAKITTRIAWCIFPAAAVSMVVRLPAVVHGSPRSPYMHIVRLRGWIGGASERGHARCQQKPSYIGAQLL
jgi:hypothetical protein